MTYRITIIGTGNVATHLSIALESAGHIINEIYGRTEEGVARITGKLYNASAVESLDFANSSSSLFIIATSDHAIEGIAAEIVLPDNGIIVHTSGTVALETPGKNSN